eukprot:CAMPEP_0202395042 /NCGR_PEP_ID=MMETSP1127-20130417/93760_1 /ASSEMBLY_ACC=CAM_ASM_000462 /TAXON_ID=3047 /ORGANISM="Dunaliella tertiolecta, Strain CCMP1320" /LENGTH=71 /DNA_ID=CAMNT_0048997717 /DNA_START=780 /DNA_END=995 /DNA_ORIENTATION=-
MELLLLDMILGNMGSVRTTGLRGEWSVTEAWRLASLSNRAGASGEKCPLAILENRPLAILEKCPLDTLVMI